MIIINKISLVHYKFKRIYRSISAAIIIAIAIVFNMSLVNISLAQSVSYGLETDSHHPIYAKNGMVASQEAHATNIGVDILKNGGNAIDAAVAVGFALAVTHPQAGNIGGGGFMVIRLKDGTSTTIDFREMAPQMASHDMFLDKDGNVDGGKSLRSHLASGVPGTVAGFLYAQQKYGKVHIKELIDPAIELAENGFVVSRSLAHDLKVYGTDVMSAHPASLAIFFDQAGTSLPAQTLLIQKDLAQSLRLISENGHAGFYEGITAQRIADEMAKNNGIMTLEDLKNYKVIERKPVMGTYKGYEIISMAPPSSGGIHIIEILNILENFNLRNDGHNSANTIQIMTEAMKYAYADRSEYLGDPDFNKVPIEALTSKIYAKQIAQNISFDKMTASKIIKPGNLTPYESDQTTHYSVVDKEGNAVSVTYTLNTSFGSGIVAAGTGILLNNQMDDFSSKPGVANVYGLIGGEANSIASGKRPLSSMSPTIVSKDGRTILVTGSPGGSRIITTVLQIILNTIEFDMNIAEATNAARFHHQWLPDYIRVEKGINIDTIKLLEAKGNLVKIEPAMGSTQSIMLSEDGFFGASDPRSEEALTAGY